MIGTDARDKEAGCELLQLEDGDSLKQVGYWSFSVAFLDTRFDTTHKWFWDIVRSVFLLKRNIKQKHILISTYCRLLKGMADRKKSKRWLLQWRSGFMKQLFEVVQWTTFKIVFRAKRSMDPYSLELVAEWMTTKPFEMSIYIPRRTDAIFRSTDWLGHLFSASCSVA